MGMYSGEYNRCSSNSRTTILQNKKGIIGFTFLLVTDNGNWRNRAAPYWITQMVLNFRVNRRAANLPGVTTYSQSQGLFGFRLLHWGHLAPNILPTTSHIGWLLLSRRSCLHERQPLDWRPYCHPTVAITSRLASRQISGVGLLES